MVTTTKGRSRGWGRGSRVWKLTPWAFLCKLCAYLNTRVLQGSYVHTYSINQGRKLSCLSSTQFNHTLNIYQMRLKNESKSPTRHVFRCLPSFLSLYFFSFSSSSACRCCTNVCLGIFLNRRKFSFWLRQF